MDTRHRQMLLDLKPEQPPTLDNFVVGANAELVARLLEAPLPPERIEGADGVAAYFRPRLALSATESFWVLMLDARGRVLGRDCVAEGTLTACLVHPREVFAPAIRQPWQMHALS